MVHFLTGYIIRRTMFTLYAMRLAILILAGFSAVSAVAGLGAVFKAIYWFIIIAGVGLELGKYITVAYVYQEWEYLTFKFKVVSVSFILVISILTSIGVLGYLGHSVQASNVTAQKDSLVEVSLTKQKATLDTRLLEIDKQVANLPDTYASGRIKLMKAFDEERKDIRDRLRLIEPRLLEAQTSALVSTGDLGPIVYIASIFGVTVEKAIGYMMLALTLSFDPFALFLTILTNRPRHSRAERKEEEEPRVNTEAWWKKYYPSKRKTPLKSPGVSVVEVDGTASASPSVPRVHVDEDKVVPEVETPSDDVDAESSPRAISSVTPRPIFTHRHPGNLNG